jgi:hypothetical protein
MRLLDVLTCVSVFIRISMGSRHRDQHVNFWHRSHVPNIVYEVSRLSSSSCGPIFAMTQSPRNDALTKVKSKSPQRLHRLNGCSLVKDTQATCDSTIR